MVAKRTPPPFEREDEMTMGEAIAPNAYLLSLEEAWRILDYRTQDFLGMSAEEFVRRLKSNDFSENEREMASMLSMMVPYSRR